MRSLFVFRTANSKQQIIEKMAIKCKHFGETNEKKSNERGILPDCVWELRIEEKYKPVEAKEVSFISNC